MNIDKEYERMLINSKCGEPETDYEDGCPWDDAPDIDGALPIYVPWRERTLTYCTYINSFKVFHYGPDSENEPEPAWINKRYFNELTHDYGCHLHRCEETPLGKPIKRIKRKETKQVKSIMITGHRPNKLPGGYNMESAPNKLLEESLYKILCKAQPTSVITGMAIGVDQIFLKAAIRYKEIDPRVNIIAAVPCKGQESLWPQESQKIYHELLSHCNTVKILSDAYTLECMKARNKWMVEHCTSAIAVYDGSSGGTQHAVNQLCTAKKTVLVIHPVTGKSHVILKGEIK
jgi:uncharacterized phage-like protein YoqJ